MVSNFSFLDSQFPVLSKFGKLAENYLYSDSNSCLMKLGMIGETIVNLMYCYDNIPVPEDNSQVAKIDYLYREGLLTNDLTSILHQLRKIRNKAAHDNYSSVSDGEKFLPITYSLCEWFMQTYGVDGYNYQNKPFVMPVKIDTAISSVNEKQIEDSVSKELIKEAEKKASEAPSQSVSDRKKKAVQANTQRIKTEAETRLLIDEQLRKVGWEADTDNIRYSKGTRPSKGRNLAIAEYPTDSKISHKGYADYALFIGEKLVAIVEAKSIHKDIPSVIDYQGKDYPRNIRQEDNKYVIGQWGEYKAPFTFATNGRPYLEQYKQKSGIWFLDLRNPDNTPIALKGWFSPDGIEELLEADIQSTNKKLEEMPYDLLTDKGGLNLRPYQLNAIKTAEKAVIDGKETVLLAMATGTGKTRTILGMIYRFLKTERFRRILFLVDRTSLGEQTYDVFKEVKMEELLTIDDIYNIKGLEDKTIDKETRIHISTVQGMVKRVLYNTGETMPAVSDYDLIIVDEAHRGYILDKEMTDDESLYRDQRDYQSKYRTVIEYFNAVKIALTATPALHTTEIFGQPVFKYTYREAVIEGYLIDHDAPHHIETKLNTEGIHYKAGDTVTVFDPVTHEILNGELLEDELDFDVEAFNKKVITESFNRTVLTEISQYIDPETPRENGKTLIYAVNDDHADMIVSILKEIYSEYGVDNDAIMKITGSVANGDRKKIQEAINRFKNEDFPSVVVTVDLLTTGIDVPSITNLVFMRRVKSRILFEQMLGRATRLCPEIHKTHFDIFDPVGVYDSLEDVNTMKPVVANPSASFEQLIEEMKAPIDSDDVLQNQINQIIAKLQRKKRNMTEETIEHFKDIANGNNPNEYIDKLQKLDVKEAKNRIFDDIELFKLLDKSRGKQLGVVISDKEDTFIGTTRGYGKSDSKPEDYLDEFSAFIHTHINEIAALNVICTRPKDLTRESLKSLKLALDREGFTQQQLNTAISQITNEEMAADIISIIRRYAIGSALISHEERIKKAVDKLRKAHKFSKLEDNWIKRMEDYLMNESVLNIQVFDEDSRFRSQGGFSRINKVFSNNLESIILELNTYLYDDGGKAV